MSFQTIPYVPRPKIQPPSFLCVFLVCSTSVRKVLWSLMPLASRRRYNDRRSRYNIEGQKSACVPFVLMRIQVIATQMTNCFQFQKYMLWNIFHPPFLWGRRQVEVHSRGVYAWEPHANSNHLNIMQLFVLFTSPERWNWFALNTICSVKLALVCNFQRYISSYFTV